MTDVGRILVLNGTSSSGKTSIARALQDLWKGPLLYLSLDAMIATLAPRYTGEGSEAALGYRLTTEEEDGEPVVRYQTGPFGQSLNRHLAGLAGALATDGFDVVIDHVLVDDNDVRALLAAGRTFLIGVQCDRSVAIRRERARGDRMIGLVRDQWPRVHAGYRPYVLEVDTTKAASASLAAAIVAHVTADEDRDDDYASGMTGP